MICSIAAEERFHLHHVVILPENLNNELAEDEKIYMKQPEGFGSINDKVLLLKKPIYVLNQSEQVENPILDEDMSDICYRRSEMSNVYTA